MNLTSIATTHNHTPFTPIQKLAKTNDLLIKQNSFLQIKQAAEQGVATMQVLLGHHYELGLSVTQSWTQAVYWYELAAQQNHTDGCYRLALLYESGKGVPQNIQTAIKYYTIAAQNKHVSALTRLGKLYYLGYAGEDGGYRAFQLFFGTRWNYWV